MKPIYNRILLKLSGEALQVDKQSSGLDLNKIRNIVKEIASIVNLGVEVGLVIGAGNIFRGADLLPSGFNRVTADQMGILATVINGLAMADVFRDENIPVRVMSAIPILGLVETYNRLSAIESLKKRNVVIFVAGSGNPLVTTDTAAALRGVEVNADIVFKATKVDGVFAADPLKNPKAECYKSLKYDELIEQRLAVMDLNSIILCRDNQLPLRVFNMSKPGALQKILLGEQIGTFIGN